MISGNRCGIREPNTLKAIDLLIQGNHIDRSFGERLKDAYEFTSFLRIKIELKKKVENTEITCCDHNHSFMAKERNALVINDDEKIAVFKIKDTLSDLREYLINFINKPSL